MNVKQLIPTLPLVFITQIWTCFAYAEGSVDSSYISFANQFCEFEMENISDVEKRKDFVEFNGEKLKYLKEHMYPIDPYVIEESLADLEVVTSCKAQSVIFADDKHAEVNVGYRVVGSRDVWGQKIKKTIQRDVIVVLSIKHDANTFKVINPEKPRVSVQYLSHYYRSKLIYGRDWYFNAGKEQLSFLRDFVDNAILMESLK